MDNEEFMRVLLESQQAHLDKLTVLVERSEERIDKTNEMIYRLARTAEKTQETLSNLASEYCKHLNEIKENRDAVMEQNKVLLKMHEQDMADKREMRKEMEAHRDQIFDLLKMMSTTSKSIKVENNFDEK